MAGDRQSDPWIREAVDPPFTAASFHECQSAGELRGKFETTNWCAGQAFWFRDLCFINQDEGGGEWLTIRHGFAFDSISWRAVIECGEFDVTLGKRKHATK